IPCIMRAACTRTIMGTSPFGTLPSARSATLQPSPTQRASGMVLRRSSAECSSDVTWQRQNQSPSQPSSPSLLPQARAGCENAAIRTRRIFPQTAKETVMTTTMAQVRALTHELAVSAWTLSAIGALYESGLTEHLREPRSVEDLAARTSGLSRTQVERVLAVAVTEGLVTNDGGRYQASEALHHFLQEPQRSSLSGDIRTQLMQALALLDAAGKKTPTIGWQHADAALLRGQGAASAAFGPAFKMRLAPMLGDLALRMESPDGRFL